MSIRGAIFENQHPFASDHALVWQKITPDGILSGIIMTYTPEVFTLNPGAMLVAGRMFEITEAENISISPGSGYARVYVTIDTGGTATETEFNQVSFGVDYAASIDSFTALTQQEINTNQGAAIYQAAVAIMSIDSSGIVAVVQQMPIISIGDFSPLTMSKLWNNASPKSAFPAQTIELDLSEVWGVLVRFAETLETAPQIYSACEIENYGRGFTMYNYRRARGFEAKRDGIIFGAGALGVMDSTKIGMMSEDNTAMIPIAIYGIKEVN